MAGLEDDLPAIVHTDPRSPGDLTPIVVDCEHALLGALLRSETVQEAVDVLAAVADEDFADPWVLLARLSLERGLHQHRLMRVLLVDAWWAGPPPITAPGRWWWRCWSPPTGVPPAAGPTVSARPAMDHWTFWRRWCVTTPRSVRCGAG